MCKWPKFQCSNKNLHIFYVAILGVEIDFWVKFFSVTSEKTSPFKKSAECLHDTCKYGRFCQIKKPIIIKTLTSLQICEIKFDCLNKWDLQDGICIKKSVRKMFIKTGLIIKY